MARRRDALKGKTYQDLINLPPRAITSMSERDIRAIVTRLNSVANKRLAALQKENLKSPISTGKDNDWIPKFSLAKKDSPWAAYRRVKSFLGAKTSTLTGARAARREAIEGLMDKGIEIADMSQAMRDEFFEIYNRIRFDKKVSAAQFQYQLMEKIVELMPRYKTIRGIVNYIEQNWSKYFGVADDEESIRSVFTKGDERNGR